MKINYYYKDIKLGTLTYKQHTYIYVSDLENEAIALQKHPLMKFYTLANSHKNKSQTLFKEFTEFLEATNRKDIIERAKIKEKDSAFTKLYKFAKLNQDTSEFYIKA
ncbi:MAG: hypothetical protein AB7S44_01825 [Spirochaetales bacterium]